MQKEEEKTGRFYLSQTILKEWEACPYRLGKRLNGSPEEKACFEYDTDPMKRGVLFETLAIGMGLGGKQAKEGDVPKESVYYKRIVEQAKLYREWERDMSSSSVGSQQQLNAKVDWGEGIYYSQGNLDRVIRDKQGVITVIDTKMTGDSENSFGPFQFGNEDRIDWTQLIHYGLLAKHNFKEEVRQMFYVADCSKRTSVKILEADMGYLTEYRHPQRCQVAYDGIVGAMQIDYWEPNPSKNNCAMCPLGRANMCKYKRTIPDIKLIILD